jgi:protein involved in polysaccharide export with SLBB domain
MITVLFTTSGTATAQEALKYLTGVEGLTPEARKALLESSQYKRITPEEIERGKAELERREREAQVRELRERELGEEEQREIELEKIEEKKIEELSTQEEELRYILDRYKGRAIRSLDTWMRDVSDLGSSALRLRDILDKYQENVINDITKRFKLESPLYRDPAKQFRNVFTENKREALAEIEENTLAARKAKAEVFEKGPEASDEEIEAAEAELELGKESLETILEDFIDRVVKDTLDTFTLKWAVRDSVRVYEAEPPHVKPVEELQLFGQDIFSRPPETFAPPTTMPVTEDYLIGPGDEIKVLMWGRIDAEYSLVVSRDGTIQFPRIGDVSVAGISYKDVKELLKKKAESITGVTISVTMGRLRSITVFVVGEVKKPGAYTVSAFDTVINALLISGGPSELGSLRNVQLKRNGKIITAVDFYDFLLRGNTARDRRLQPGDVIFVPEAKILVAVTGNVKRPAIYELRGDEGLNNLIDLAGGLAPSAYKQRIQIERLFEHRKQVVLDLTYDGNMTASDFTLQDGDVVRVFPFAPEKVDAVYVYGNVFQPGSYEFRPGMRITDVIKDETEVKSDTDFSYALIKRYVEPEMQGELVPFNLGRAIVARDERSNIILKPYDEIYIFNKWLFTFKRYVKISGEVREPETYPLQDKMRIKDLIITAGGLNREAYLGKSHLFRTDPRTKNVSMIVFNLQKAIKDDPESNLLLQDQDEVVIRSIRELKPEEFVSIYGMVNNPGQYPLAVGMTIRDLVMAGGNLRKEAYKQQAELVRFEIIDGERMETEVFSFDLADAIAGNPRQNLTLQDYDRVFVKRIPQWLEEMQVTIEGEVNYPGDYYARINERLSSLIERAGGFTREAYLRGAVFTRESARLSQRKRLDEMISRMEEEIAAETGVEVVGALSPEEVQAFQVALEAKRGLLKKLKEAKVTGRLVIQLARLEELKDSKFDLRLEDQDHLFIPKMPEFVNVLGEVYNPTSFLHEPGKRVTFYLNRAGGPTKNAEDDEMYIIRADGSVLSRSQGGKAMRWDADTNRWTSESFKSAKIYPGDSLLVPRELVRIHWIKEVRDITQILFQIAVVVGVIAAI